MTAGTSSARKNLAYSSLLTHDVRDHATVTPLTLFSWPVGHSTSSAVLFLLCRDIRACMSVFVCVPHLEDAPRMKFHAVRAHAAQRARFCALATKRPHHRLTAAACMHAQR